MPAFNSSDLYAVLKTIGYGVLVLWPTWRIFKRTGLSPLWSLAVLIPFFGQLLCLTVLVLRPWPHKPVKEGI